MFLLNSALVLLSRALSENSLPVLGFKCVVYIHRLVKSVGSTVIMRKYSMVWFLVFFRSAVFCYSSSESEDHS